MRLLVDTHTLFWSVMKRAELSPAARSSRLLKKSDEANFVPDRQRVEPTHRVLRCGRHNMQSSLGSGLDRKSPNRQGRGFFQQPANPDHAPVRHG